jgi:hypothetical protein
MRLKFNLIRLRSNLIGRQSNSILTDVVLKNATTYTTLVVDRAFVR